MQMSVSRVHFLMRPTGTRLLIKPELAKLLSLLPRCIILVDMAMHTIINWAQGKGFCVFCRDKTIKYHICYSCQKMSHLSFGKGNHFA